jgi:hypothetical protein
VPTKTHVLNLLHRLIDGKAHQPPPIDAPQACACAKSPRPMSNATMPCVREERVMRHDPASAAIVIMLRGLKMHGMAQAVGDLIEQGAPAFEAAIPILSQLLKAETAEREVAPSPTRSRPPGSRPTRTWPASTSPAARSTRPWSASCIAASSSMAPNNVVLIGGPGTGKTHIATALGVQAIEHHRKRVRFFSTVELVNALEQEKAKGKAGQIAERLLHSISSSSTSWATCRSAHQAARCCSIC